MHNVGMQNPTFQERFLVSFSDNRSWLSRIKDFSFATVKELKCRLQRQYNPLRVNVHNSFPVLQANSNTYHIDEQQWVKSKKLVVLIHGLNSSPLAWTDYLEEKSKFENNVSYFTPFVYKKGYCKCKEAARPILEVVKRYADQYPSNPIILVGHSNGARIAAYIEQKLDVDNIRLISIAGPHCGSMLINWINALGLTRFLGISAKLVEELTFQGSWAKRKLIKWHDQQQNISTKRNIERVFFASYDDWRIFPNQTSFPKLPNSSYFCVSGESHVTIIEAVKQKVLSYIYTENDSKCKF